MDFFQKLAGFGCARQHPIWFKQVCVATKEDHFKVTARWQRLNGAREFGAQGDQFVAHHGAANVAYKANIFSPHACAKKIHATGGGVGFLGRRGSFRFGDRVGRGRDPRLGLRGAFKFRAAHTLIQLSVQSQRAIFFNDPCGGVRQGLGRGNHLFFGLICLRGQFQRGG